MYTSDCIPKENCKSFDLGHLEWIAPKYMDVDMAVKSLKNLFQYKSNTCFQTFFYESFRSGISIAVPLQAWKLR